MERLVGSPEEAYSPKGNQDKWYDGKVFVKQDKFNGESLSEYLVSLVYGCR